MISPNELRTLRATTRTATATKRTGRRTTAMALTLRIWTSKKAKMTAKVNAAAASSAAPTSSCLFRGEPINHADAACAHARCRHHHIHIHMLPFPLDHAHERSTQLRGLPTMTRRRCQVLNGRGPERAFESPGEHHEQKRGPRLPSRIVGSAKALRCPRRRKNHARQIFEVREHGIMILFAVINQV